MSAESGDSRSFHEQVQAFQKRLEFLKDSLISTYFHLPEHARIAEDTNKRYMELLAKLNDDEELLEPEFLDVLGQTLSRREKEVQAFIDILNQ